MKFQRKIFCGPLYVWVINIFVTLVTQTSVLSLNKNMSRTYFACHEVKFRHEIIVAKSRRPEITFHHFGCMNYCYAFPNESIQLHQKCYGIFKYCTIFVVTWNCALVSILTSNTCWHSMKNLLQMYRKSYIFLMAVKNQQYTEDKCTP